MTLPVEVLAAEDWAEEVGRTLTGAMASGTGMRLCLATGNTTGPVYRKTRAVGDPVIFLLDEFGGLPAGDPGRCEAMFLRDFPEHPFLVPDVDSADPVSAADRYGVAVRDGGLDLAVVGLGRNGHIGMNEPGSGPNSPTRVVELADETRLGAAGYGASALPTWGITIGMAELMGARELWLVVTGPHKAGILESMMQSTIGPQLPATYLRDHPNARIIADTAAAERL